MKIFLTFFIIISSTNLSAQKTNYSIPDGYESIISKKDYKYLVDESIKSISKNYKINSVKEGVIELEKEQDYAIINLHNLILNCLKIDKENWSEFINTHFENMYESIKKQKQIDLGKFETVADYLSIRLYPENYATQNIEIGKLISKKQLDGTISLLVLDLPASFASVQKEIFDLWNKPIDEVFDIAQKNVNKQEFTQATEYIEVNGQKIEINFIENEDYGASLALDLITNAPEFVGEWGSVIAIPNKGIVDICKITKEKPLDFIIFIQQVRPIVEQFYNQHPQRISKNFYWYYKNKFTKINIIENNGEFNIISPIELTELMTEK